MDDLISRAAAKAAIRGKFQSVADRCEINEVLNGLPAVDAAPVVRCGECRMRNNAGYCPDLEMFVGERFFCAYGRRETNVTERAVAEMAGIRQDDHTEAGG